jgi:hypothetical protein
MPQLHLTDDQVLDLVKQLPAEQQERLFASLAGSVWPTWSKLSAAGQGGARAAAARRGQDWDAMTEDERERFIDDVVHEDHRCSG